MRAITLVVAGVATLLAASPCRAEPPQRAATQEEEEVQYARWPWPVVLEGKASKETIALGEKLRQVLGVKFSLQSGATRNPGCCMWVQITNWTPNPGKPGYVVVIQPGGGWIQASDLSQLEKAIDQIAAVVRKVNGDCELPVGVLTSYGRAEAGPQLGTGAFRIPPRSQIAEMAVEVINSPDGFPDIEQFTVDEKYVAEVYAAFEKAEIDTSPFVLFPDIASVRIRLKSGEVIRFAVHSASSKAPLNFSLMGMRLKQDSASWRGNDQGVAFDSLLRRIYFHQTGHYTFSVPEDELKARGIKSNAP